MVEAVAAEPRRRSVLCASPAGLHRVAYREWGDPRNRDVLVCVHGLTRSGRDFDELARALCGTYFVKISQYGTEIIKKLIVIR